MSQKFFENEWVRIPLVIVMIVTGVIVLSPIIVIITAILVAVKIGYPLAKSVFWLKKPAAWMWNRIHPIEIGIYLFIILLFYKGVKTIWSENWFNLVDTPVWATTLAWALPILIILISLVWSVSYLYGLYGRQIWCRMSPEKTSGDSDKKKDNKKSSIPTVLIIILISLVIGVSVWKIHPELVLHVFGELLWVVIVFGLLLAILMILPSMYDDKEAEQARKTKIKWFTRFVLCGIPLVILYSVYSYTSRQTSSGQVSASTVSAPSAKKLGEMVGSVTVVPVKEFVSSTWETVVPPEGPPKRMYPPSRATILYQEELKLLASQWSEPLGKVHPKMIAEIRDNRGETWLADNVATPIQAKIANGTGWRWADNRVGYSIRELKGHESELQLKAEVDCTIYLWVWK